MKEFFDQFWQIILDSNLLNLLAAVLVLLLGWLIAVVLSSRTTRLLNKLTMAHDRSKHQSHAVSNLSNVSGKVVFYLVMLITLLGCFSLLKLHAAAAPLQEFFMQLAAYLPKLAGALLLVLAAWICGGIVRSAVRMTMHKNALQSKFANKFNGKTAESVIEYTAQTACCTIWLFFLPGILNALGIYGITQALQNMFEKFFAYLPNLIAALCILLVGWWAAQIVRRAVSGLAEASQLQKLLQNLAITRNLNGSWFANCCGTTAYVLVAIPILIAALTALRIEVLSKTIAAFLEQLLSGAGDIIGAIIITVLTITAARLSGKLITRLSAAWGIDKFASEVMPGKAGSVSLSNIAGRITTLAVVLIGFIAVCDVLKLVSLAKLLKTFAFFGGDLILSMIVVVIGLYLAEFTASLVRGKWNNVMVSMLKSAVIIFTLALAISNIDLGSGIVEIAFTLLLGAFAIAFAIAFGIGGKETAAKLLAQWMEKMKK